MSIWWDGVYTRLITGSRRLIERNILRFTLMPLPRFLFVENAGQGPDDLHQFRGIFLLAGLFG